MAIDVSRLVGALGGEVVGKVRLQKVVYLLNHLGLDSGFDYDYPHYGPYSAQLAEAVELEVIFGDLEEETRRRQSDGVPYTVYSASVDHPEPVGGLDVDGIRRASGIFEKYSATVLELAATAYWLVHEEGIEDWRSELINRKGVKTKNGRTEMAVTLLHELGLKL